MNSRIPIGRACLAGAAGSIAGLLVYQLLVPLVARFTLDPRYQGAEFMAVLNILLAHKPSASHVTGAAFIWVVLFGSLHGIVFSLMASNLPESKWSRGVVFGLLVWALSYGFFEFVSPWTQFEEPIKLLALEISMWLVVALVDGLMISILAGMPRVSSTRERAAA
jgi:hypothetical protein